MNALYRCHEDIMDNALLAQAIGANRVCGIEGLTEEQQSAWFAAYDNPWYNEF